MEEVMGNLALKATGSTPHFSELINLRTWDDMTGIYRTQTGFGVACEILPVVGFNEADLTTIENLFHEFNLDQITVQVVNFASNKIGKILDSWTQHRHEKMFSDSRVSTFEEAVQGKKFASHQWRPRHYRCFIFLHLTSANLSVAQEEMLIRSNERIIQTFKTLRTQCKKLPANKMISLIEDMLMPSSSSVRPAEEQWSDQEYLHEQIAKPGVQMDVNFNEIRFTGDIDGAARCFTVRQMPETWPPGGSATLIGDIFRPTNFCSQPVIQSITLKAAALSADLVGIRAGRADKAARSPLRFINPNTAIDAEDYADVGAAMAGGQEMVTIHYQLVLFSEAETIDEAEVKLTNLFDRQGFGLIKENGLHLFALQCALPFGGSSASLNEMKRFGRTRTVKLTNAVALWPFYGEWQGNNDNNKPPLMLLSGRRGELAGWTPFNSNANYNVCIIGQSGQGKSVAMQEIMVGLMSVGGAAIVIDDGYSFKNSCHVLGGSHVDFGGADLELNPFAAIDKNAVEEDTDFAEAAMSMLVNVIGALCHPGKEPSDLERAVLTSTVQQVWRDKGTSGKIDDVITVLKLKAKESKAKNEKSICEDLITLLKPSASDGVYGRLFAGGCSVTMNHNLMVFELSHLRDKKEIQASAMVLLIFLATQKMYKSPREMPVAVMVDEAWSLLSGATADFIESVARRARKYQGCLITATQGVDDYFRSRAAEAAWANSSWRLFFSMQDASINALKEEKKINCDEVLERGLRSLQSIRDVWSEVIVHGDSGWDITRLVLDPISLAAFSSTGEDVAAIDALIKSGLSRMDAIKAHAVAAGDK
jgi:conjugal transfer ATP-binding protein TraC